MYLAKALTYIDVGPNILKAPIIRSYTEVTTELFIRTISVPWNDS